MAYKLKDPKKKKCKGVPVKEFSKKEWKQLENLCQIQCTGEEIAAIMGVDYDTLNRIIATEYENYSGFSEYFKEKSAGGKASLRRRQWLKAQEGNVVMQIWLGKQYLGQSEPKSD